MPFTVDVEQSEHYVRLATLAPGDPASYNSETVARRLGVDLRSFDNEEEALAWFTQRESSIARPAAR